MFSNGISETLLSLKAESTVMAPQESLMSSFAIQLDPVSSDIQREQVSFVTGPAASA
jgi:hypothetical protein